MDNDEKKKKKKKKGEGMGLLADWRRKGYLGSRNQAVQMVEDKKGGY